MRCFSRAIKRAEIDIWYTEGYNPRPYMNFSLPLSLGTESLCETLDIRTNDEMPFDEIKERLNAVLPVGIRITKCAPPVNKTEKIGFADYEVYITAKDSGSVCGFIKSKLESEEILVEKKAKQGKKRIIKEVNIRPNIKSYELTKDENQIKLSMTLCAGAQNNTNTTLLLGAILPEDVDSVRIIKTKMFTDEMKEFE